MAEENVQRWHWVNLYSYIAGCVLLGILALMFAVSAWYTKNPHDWDCSKHGGVVDRALPRLCADGYDTGVSWSFR